MRTWNANVASVASRFAKISATLATLLLLTAGCALAQPTEGGEAALKRSEEHTSELQSPFLISYAVFCLDRKSVV